VTSAIIISFALIAFLIILIIIRILFPPKKYGIKSVSSKGEEVKSIAEKTITDYFVNNKINYVYEQEAKKEFFLFSKRIFSNRISHPDFYLPDYNVYVEYWGLVDAEDSRLRNEYVRSMKWKMAQYHQNNIKFISIYPSNLSNLDWIFRKKFKEVTGFELAS
jgi:hypothetical protein